VGAFRNKNRKMKTATVIVLLDQFKNTAFLHGVTPAQAAVLKEMFEPQVSLPPVEFVEYEKDINRSPADEVHRLKTMYKPETVEKLFPGVVPRLPETFEEAGVRKVVAAATSSQPVNVPSPQTPASQPSLTAKVGTAPSGTTVPPAAPAAVLPK
jgi:hypothetical protein